MPKRDKILGRKTEKRGIKQKEIAIFSKEHGKTKQKADRKDDKIMFYVI